MRQAIGFGKQALIGLWGLVIFAGCSSFALEEDVDQSVLQAEAIGVDPAITSDHCPVFNQGLIEAEALPAFFEKGKCGHEAPFSVTALNGEAAVRFSQPAKLNCAMASQLQRFFAQSVQPLSQDYFDQKVVSVRVAASYACRSRNHKSGAKLSEHATMNAFDLGSLTLEDGTVLSVLDDWSGMGRKARFMKAVNRQACRYFTTVIGPGGDRYHQNHFHFDLGRHGRKGTWRLCQ